MNCCGWNCDALPRMEPQFYAALQVDNKQAFYDSATRNSVSIR